MSAPRERVAGAGGIYLLRRDTGDLGDSAAAVQARTVSPEGGWLSDEAVVREAVRRGTAAGALACTDYGAMRALPTREELERFLSVRS